MTVDLKKVHRLANFYSVILLLGSLGSYPFLAHAATDSRAEMNYLLLLRRDFSQAKKTIPYLQERVDSFMTHAKRLADPRIIGSHEGHYRSMMNELMLSYEVLQDSKAYLIPMEFTRISRQWRLIQERVILSQKLYTTDNARAKQILSDVIAEVQTIDDSLKNWDKML